MKSGVCMKRNVTAYILSLFVVMTFLSGCGDNAEEKAEKSKVVADRQMLMREMSGSVQGLEDALFSGESEEAKKKIMEHAQLLQSLSADLANRFETKAKDGSSQAKNEVWSNKEQFDKAAKELKAKIDEFALAVKSEDSKTMQNAYRKLDMGSVCMQCHQAYRKGPKERGVP